MRRAALSPLIVLVFLAAAHAEGPKVPYLSGRVIDEAHMLAAASVSSLEALLAAYEDSTGNQIAVLTVPSLEGENIESFALRVAETWKLGRKGTDNGALLLVARDDREMRIEVGYGLEASLTDAATSYIVRNVITPRFKDGDFDGGVRAGVEALIQAADGTLDTSEGDSGGDETAGLAVFGGVWMLVISFMLLGALTTPGWRGWVATLFLLPFVAVPAIIAGVLAGFTAGVVFLGVWIVLVVALRLWLPRTDRGTRFLDWMRRARRGGGSSVGIGPFTFGSSGGSSWGGSSGGGGFSGGGGSFGGGGSSGSW